MSTIKGYFQLDLIIYCLVFFNALTLGCGHEQQDISGQYVGTQVLQGTTSAIAVNFRYNGDQLAGTVTPPSSQEAIAFNSASYSGGQIVFQCSKDGTLYKYVATYSPGGVASASISGTVAGNNSETGTFTATRH